MRPSLFLTAEELPGLRSVSKVRQAVASGHGASLWDVVRDKAKEELCQAPLTPASPIAGRPPIMERTHNPDNQICHAVGLRLLRAALVHVLTGDLAYREAAVLQMEALFDENQWPAWCDRAHYVNGEPTADLRTGALSQDVAIVYDWLHASLTDQERKTIIEGLGRRGIEPFFRALEREPSWANNSSNWMAQIVGGMGIVGMALGGDHPQSRQLVDYSLPRMRRYLSIYGPNGEFNESPAYSNSTAQPVRYFMAYLYWTGGGENLLAQSPFPQACRWLMYLTLPPGRVAAFGDANVDGKPSVPHFAAIAAACRDEVLQWFYLQHVDEATQCDPHHLLYYDATLQAASPQGKLPLGGAFPAHGGCISSRTSWDQRSAAGVVYGKAGREKMHANNDAGQLCIDGFGERLIIDLGAPSSYPPDFFSPNRCEYYNAAANGHNILTFGGREMRAGAQHCGEIADSGFDDAKGAFWKIDLTAAYDGANFVRRTVVHLFPGIVVVLDEAELERSEEISLRWHTADNAEPDAAGNFRVVSGKAVLTGRMLRVDEGNISFARGQHAYSSPFDRGRTGELLKQRYESYVEGRLRSDACRLLSVFAVTEQGAEASLWRKQKNGLSACTPDGDVAVTYDSGLLVENVTKAQSWKV